ncbi:MipA/OmpV family protein [Sphingomonas bacterium]|uniref:MipA/OmpV family protein n=1 Tax=Sphingomonas bacterium TaxID=1895847 RepID=UPI0020C6EBDE|nr:MipA/OmpV family protein [Sphingomonas bacterium]
MRLNLVLAALTGAIVSTVASAQDAPPSGSSAREAMAADLGKDTITVGGGGVYLPDYEGSKDYRFTAAPAALGSYKGFNFQLIGNRFNIDLIPDSRTSKFDFQAGPIAVLNLNRDSLKQINNRQVRALGELGNGIELGGFVGFGKTGIITSPYDKLSISVSYRHDVNNVSDSRVVTPSINYLTPLSTKAAVALFGSADNAGRGYAQTYFGVTAQQSLASGLAIYSPGSGWKSVTGGGVVTYSLTGNLLHGFKVLAGGTYTKMLGDFGNSPLVRTVGSRNQWIGAAGLAYTF